MLLHFNVGHNGGTWKAKFFSEVVLGVKSLRTTAVALDFVLDGGLRGMR